MSLTGLPPIPNSLKECLKDEATNGCNFDVSGCHVSVSPSGSLVGGIHVLQNKMHELRDMDRNLFKHLWSIYESIQDFKQSMQDRLSETNSECSYSMDSQLETIPDYKEHIYVNEKFHNHIYENQHVYEAQSSISSGYSSMKEEDNVYEPVYIEPKCHKGHKGEVKGKSMFEKSIVKSSISTNSGNRKSSTKQSLSLLQSSGSIKANENLQTRTNITSTSSEYYSERSISRSSISYSPGKSSDVITSSGGSRNSSRSDSSRSSRSSLGSTPKGNRFSGIFTQTTYESTC